MNNCKISCEILVRKGFTVGHKDITLCDLRDHCYWLRKKTRGYYQVWSNDFTQIYDNINEAVDKFFELKGK